MFRRREEGGEPRKKRRNWGCEMPQTHMFHDVDKVVIKKELPLTSGDYRTTIRFKDVEIVLFSKKLIVIEGATKWQPGNGC